MPSHGPANLGDLAGLDGFVAAQHRLDRLFVPSQVDERRLVVADAVDELVNEANPFVEVRVLHRVAVVRRAIVVDVRTETVAADHALVAGDGDV